MSIVTMLLLMSIVMVSCDEWPHNHGDGGAGANQTRSYPADLAVAWINLQQDLTKTTPGFDPLVAARAFSYSGVTLYESLVKGMPGHHSIAAPFMGSDGQARNLQGAIFWPASANAAMLLSKKKSYGRVWATLPRYCSRIATNPPIHE